MKLSREIFWDTDYDTLNWEKHRHYIICRVLDRGSMNDWFEIKKKYGIIKILHSAKKARYLSKKTVHFLSNIFDVPLKEFRCYRLMRSQPEQWMF